MGDSQLSTDMDYFEDDLYESICKGDKNSMLEYLKKGLDVNHAFRSTDRSDRLGKTLVEIGVKEKQIEIVELLVNNKANTNLTYRVDVNNYAYRLMSYKKKDILKLTCMYPCIVKNDLEMIKLIIQGGFDVNIHDDRGCTPLWHAVDLNNYEMTKAVLVSKACDVNVSDNAMLRPIHIAAMHANSKIVSLLIRNGAMIDPVQIRGWTPLNLACRSGCFATTRMLILNGADPNHVGYNGHTPLSMSLEFGDDRRIPEMLLEVGAAVDQNFIRRCKKEKMVNLILNPDLFHLLKMLSETPRSLKTLCCLQIRKCMLQSSPEQDIIQKTKTLPLPTLMKETLLLAYL